LVEAYLMVNCKDVIVAKENVKSIMKKIDDESDKIIEIISNVKE
jgi:hypothetical protein